MTGTGFGRALAALGFSLLATVAGIDVAAAASQPASSVRVSALDSQPDRASSRPPNARTDQPDRALPPADRRDTRDSFRGNDRLERRLSFLHSELRIREDQQRLWDDFANVVREEAENARDRYDSFRDRRDFRDSRPSVLERLEQRQDRLRSEDARLDHLLSALRPLYAALNPEQKRAADALLFRPERGPFFDARRFGRMFRRNREPFYGSAPGRFAADQFDWRFGPNPNLPGGGPYDYLDRR